MSAAELKVHDIATIYSVAVACWIKSSSGGLVPITVSYATTPTKQIWDPWAQSTCSGSCRRICWNPLFIFCWTQLWNQKWTTLNMVYMHPTDREQASHIFSLWASQLHWIDARADNYCCHWLWYQGPQPLNLLTTFTSMADDWLNDALDWTISCQPDHHLLIMVNEWRCKHWMWAYKFLYKM